MHCEYRYPEQEHLNALLSAIMNRLTKVYVHMRQARPELRAKRGQRFKVVGTGEVPFDTIYKNMTLEYKQWANVTRNHASSALRSNPCRHQDEIRRVWNDLLDAAENSLRRATKAFMDDYQRSYHNARGRDVTKKTGSESSSSEAEGSRDEGSESEESFVEQELSRARGEQLEVLCDRFQLCYHDLNISP